MTILSRGTTMSQIKWDDDLKYSILQLKMNEGINYDFVVKLFSVNYNILVFTGGMSGLVFNI